MLMGGVAAVVVIFTVTGFDDFHCCRSVVLVLITEYFYDDLVTTILFAAVKLPVKEPSSGQAYLLENVSLCSSNY